MTITRDITKKLHCSTITTLHAWDLVNICKSEQKTMDIFTQQHYMGIPAIREL